MIDILKEEKKQVLIKHFTFILQDQNRKNSQIRLKVKKNTAYKTVETISGRTKPSVLGPDPLPTCLTSFRLSTSSHCTQIMSVQQWPQLHSQVPGQGVVLAFHIHSTVADQWEQKWDDGIYNFLQICDLLILEKLSASALFYAGEDHVKAEHGLKTDSAALYRHEADSRERRKYDMKSSLTGFNTVNVSPVWRTRCVTAILIKHLINELLILQ